MKSPLARRRVRRVLARGMRASRPIRRLLYRGSPLPTQVHLSWTRDPAHTLVIAWKTGALRMPAQAEIRLAAGSEWRRFAAMTVRAAGGGLLHCSAIDGLEPATAYELRVSGDPERAEHWSAIHRARTAPARANDPFCAVFFADVGIAARRDGTSDAAPRVIAEMIADAPLVALGGGDYAYADTDTRFFDPADAIDAWFGQMQPLFARAPFMPVFGNHEIELGEGYEEWAPRLALPDGEEAGRSYSFDIGAAHFCALHAPGQVPAPRHLAWLDRDLAAARRGGASWIVVYQHAAVFGNGTAHPAHPGMRTALSPILERHRVDLHLSAHDQSYERTHPLVEGASRAASRDPQRIAAGSGVVYAKISPAGKRSNRGGDFSRLLQPMSADLAARHDACHHYGLLRVCAQRLDVEVVGVPEDGPRRTIDRFSIEA